MAPSEIVTPPLRKPRQRVDFQGNSRGLMYYDHQDRYSIYISAQIIGGLGLFDALRTVDAQKAGTCLAIVSKYYNFVENYLHSTGRAHANISGAAFGKRRREKVGKKDLANKLYQKRRGDIVSGRKLPELRDSKALRFSELIDDALEYVADHKDFRSYASKAGIVWEALGKKLANELTPQEIERWLRSRCKTPATANRYKAFISLCYRKGVHNGKVTINPARLVRHRREGSGRLRFLTRDEYVRLYKVIEGKLPEHLAEFIISVNTGCVSPSNTRSRGARFILIVAR